MQRCNDAIVKLALPCYAKNISIGWRDALQREFQGYVSTGQEG